MGGDKVRLCARCRIDNFIDEIVWYEVDKEWGQYLCYERADAFVLNFLMYAMKNKLDIVSMAPVSEKLYYQLATYFVPSIAKWVKGYESIKITAPLDSKKINTENAVATACSGGVDSFYTIYKHMNLPAKSYNLTHLTFFNAGASGEYGGDMARKTFKERIEWIKPVVKELGLPLITVDTNINEILMEVHIFTVTSRALAMVLALQKLFSVYYWSSTHSFMEFEFTEHDMEPYDLLNVQCFSTEDVNIYGCGGEALRIDKEAFIADYELPRKKLNVCISKATNCSRCDKCKRTMLGLYTIGKLDQFSQVFDTEYFYSHKYEFLRDLQNKKTEFDWWECYEPLRPELGRISDSSMKQMFLESFEKILSGHKVVLRGNGMHTHELIRLFPRRSEIVGIWDTAKGSEEVFGGYKIYRSLDEVRKLGVDTAYISSWYYRKDIMKEFESTGACKDYRVIDPYELLEIPMDKPFYFYDFR